MKKLNLLCSIFLSSSLAIGQTLTETTTVPDLWDQYPYKQLDIIPDSLETGANAIWDFSAGTPLSNQQLWKILPPTESIHTDSFSTVDYVVDYGDDSRGFRYLENGTLRTAGYITNIDFNGNGILTIYEGGEPWLEFPISQSFSNQASFSYTQMKTGNVPTEKRHGVCSFDQQVLGSGDLMINANIQYEDVLLIRTTRVWIDTADNDPTDVDTTDTHLYYWYSEDLPYQLAMTWGEDSAGAVTSQRLRYLDTASMVLPAPELQSNGIDFFPNPASNIIQFTTALKGMVVIQDIQGRTVLETQLNDQLQMDVSGFTSGAYTISIEQDGTVRSRVLLVE